MHSSDMRRFLKRLSVFLLLLIAVLALFEVGFRTKRTPFKGKYDGLEKYASEIEILALGHSHANEGFNPRMFTHRAYNMAMGFQNVYFDDYILGHFIDRMDSLKCVVISMSYFHFLNELPHLNDMQGEDVFNTVKYHLYWGAEKIYDEKISDWNPKYNLEILNNPATSYIGMFKYYLSGDAFRRRTVDSWSDFLRYGFNGGQDVVNTEAYLDDNGIRDARAHTWGKDAEPVNYHIYEHIVQVCQSHGVNVVLMLYPCWHSYYENMDADQIAQARTLMEQLSYEYGNCFVLDYLADPRFDPHDFHDASHLNKYGAEKISAILNDDLAAIVANE